MILKHFDKNWADDEFIFQKNLNQELFDRDEMSIKNCNKKGDTGDAVLAACIMQPSRRSSNMTLNYLAANAVPLEEAIEQAINEGKTSVALLNTKSNKDGEP